MNKLILIMLLFSGCTYKQLPVPKYDIPRVGAEYVLPNTPDNPFDRYMEYATVKEVYNGWIRLDVYSPDLLTRQFERCEMGHYSIDVANFNRNYFVPSRNQARSIGLTKERIYKECKKRGN